MKQISAQILNTNGQYIHTIKSDMHIPSATIVEMIVLPANTTVIVAVNGKSEFFFDSETEMYKAHSVFNSIAEFGYALPFAIVKFGAQ